MSTYIDKLLDFAMGGPALPPSTPWIAYINSTGEQVGPRDLGKGIQIWGYQNNVTLPPSTANRGSIERVEIWSKAVCGELMIYWNIQPLMAVRGEAVTLPSPIQ